MVTHRRSDDTADIDRSSLSFGNKFFSVSAFGRTSPKLLIAALAVIVIVATIYVHDRDNKERQLVLIENQKSMHEAQEETTYVLTLPQDERKQLKLDMPRSLKLRIRGRDN